MEAYTIQEKPAEELKPPVTSVGIIGWVTHVDLICLKVGLTPF